MICIEPGCQRKARIRPVERTGYVCGLCANQIAVHSWLAMRRAKSVQAAEAALEGGDK